MGGISNYKTLRLVQQQQQQQQKQQQYTSLASSSSSTTTTDNKSTCTSITTTTTTFQCTGGGGKERGRQGYFNTTSTIVKHDATYEDALQQQQQQYQQQPHQQQQQQQQQYQQQHPQIQQQQQQQPQTNPVSSSSSSSSSLICRTTLDALDETFNARRRVRELRIYEFVRQSIVPGRISFFDSFEPESVCFTDERFGGGSPRYNAFGDGPKFICGLDYLKDFSSSSSSSTSRQQQPMAMANNNNNNNNDGQKKKKNCLVYSVGSNNEIDFEESISTLLPHCETHTFDPTLTTPFIGDAYSTFHPWGIGEDNATITYGNNNNLQFVTKSLLGIYHALNHTGRTLDILKIDCEGCEYTAMIPLLNAIAAGDIQVDQILIELHMFDPGEPSDTTWQKLVDLFHFADRAKLRIFHKERNHWGCNGMGCVEYSLISEDFLRRANGHVVCGGSGSGSSSGGE
jgi:hypothetical protein